MRLVATMGGELLRGETELDILRNIRVMLPEVPMAEKVYKIGGA